MSSYTDEELQAMGIDIPGFRKRGSWGAVDPTFPGFGRGGEREPLRAMDLAALAGVEPSPVHFIVQGLLPAAETTLLTAPGGGNKTTLCLMIAVAMAARLDSVLGLAIEPGPAAYIGMEDSEGRLHWMLYHICGGLGVSMLDLAGRLHVVSMRQVMHNGLASFDHGGEIEPGDLYHQAQELVEATGAKLLVLDNLAHLFLGNENDRMQATRFLSLLNKLASDTGAAILLLAHTPKSGADYSGSTGWQNATRSHAAIEKEEGGDPDVRVLKVSKGNYVKPGEVTRFRWFDHYLIRPDDLPADIASQLAATSRATAANEAFVRCLAVVEVQGRSVSHARGINYAPRLFAKMPEARGFDEDDLDAAMERLLRLGVIALNQEVGRYENRTVRRGIKQVAELAQEGRTMGAQEGCTTGAPTAQSPSAQAHNADARSTPPPTGEIEGDYSSPSIPLGGDGRGPDWVPGDD